MRNTQSKFFDLLKRETEFRGLELVVNPQYDNTGSFSIEYPDSFNQIIYMKYRFNDDYASFSDISPHIGDREGNREFPHVNASDLEVRVIRAIRRYLDAYLAENSPKQK